VALLVRPHVTVAGRALLDLRGMRLAPFQPGGFVRGQRCN